MKIAIIYYSGFGHTKVVAHRIALGARKIIDQVTVLTTVEATTRLAELSEVDTLVFGSPTYFANVSADFKKFMEATASIWAKQSWKNKLAAGFTNSSSTNGDKLSTLINLSLFAAQHGMLWIPLGIMPKYDHNGRQLSKHNGMASYLGLMTMSDNAHNQFNEPADLISAELFGERIAEVSMQLKSREQELLPN